MSAELSQRYARSVLRVMVDTCVWLDLAKDIRGEQLIATVRTLVHGGAVQLLVPQLVIDEYDRNRPQVVASLAAGTRAHIKFARAALAEHGRRERTPELLAELDEVAVRGPLIEELVVNRFEEVRDLLTDGQELQPTDRELARVVQRGLDKRGPFHLQKNSTADALLIELYWTAANVPLADPSDHFAFVTHNTKDFSDPKDTRKPHPDLAACFDLPHSAYFTALKDALSHHLPREFEELWGELAYEEDPRSGREILEAEQRLFDLIWYQRSVSDMDPLGERGRKRVEETYPTTDLGPFTEFEWGMLNGKLSALRWVLGSDWDFLDT